MTDDMKTLRGLLEKSSDADLLREMIGFSAQRLMELEVEDLGSESFMEKATYIILFAPFMRRAEFSRNYRWRFDTALRQRISISP